MYQDTRRLDFHALGKEIKRKREAKGWTQEYLAQLVDRTPRSIMYIENRGQHPSLNTFYQLVTLLEISVAAPPPKQISWRLVRLKATFVFTLDRSLGTFT